MNKKIKYILFTIVLFMFLSIPNVYAKSGWVTEKNNKYYYENNKKVLGFKNIDRKTYFFSYKNGALKYGWQQLDGNKWYQNKYGEVIKSWYTISGKKYYFNNEGYLLTGFQTINGTYYFFSNITGELKYGWQSSNGNSWYQNKYGEVVKNWQTINKKKYFFNEEGFLQKGFQTVNGTYYFFSNITGELKYGWQSSNGNSWYQNKYGEVVKNWQIIEGKKYYFDDNGFIQKGFQTIDGKEYFFSNITGELKYGWQGSNGNTWYQNNEGVVYKTPGWATIDNKKYYFDDNGYILKGFQTVEGKYYFFSNITGELKYGWQGSNGNTWYQDNEGVVYTTPGWATINNKKYYFENNYAYKGIKEIDGRKYYFNETTCEQITTTINNKYLEIIINPETTEFIRKQYKPVYYSQNDKQWGYYGYGFSNLAKTGCAPSSMAMAFSAIKGRDILPPEIADYLYNYTDQYNRIYVGTSGLGIIYAAQKYGINYKGITSEEDLKNELEKGNIVFAAMADGKFATKNWNHAIIVFNYNKEYNTTYAYDPLTTDKNGWASLDIIWNQKSNDPDDLLGGYALYSLY